MIIYTPQLQKTQTSLTQYQQQMHEGHTTITERNAVTTKSKANVSQKYASITSKMVNHIVYFNFP